jgi:hypothetical protein
VKTKSVLAMEICLGVPSDAIRCMR